MGPHVKFGNNRKILETGNKYICGKCNMWKNNKHKVKGNIGSGIGTSGYLVKRT